MDNRTRFIRTMLGAVRERVGPDYPIGLRFSLFDATGAAYDVDEGVAILAAIEDSGLVDEFSIYGGMVDMEVYDGLPGSAGAYAQVVGKARAAMRHGTPVLCVGAVNDPRQAEEILARGRADAVGMVRALIADPDMPTKARTGRLHGIRRCVYSAEGCLGFQGAFGAPEIRCTVNPSTGFEREHAALPPITVARHVLVVGGGPAGLKAAEQAAERGHRVTLAERDEYLGGQVTLQSGGELRRLERVAVDHLVDRCTELGVEVRTGVEITPALVRELAPDVVVLATGSVPVRTGYTGVTWAEPGLPGADRDFVLTTEDVLRGAPTGERVVVVDGSAGDYTVPVTVERLLADGRHVTVLTEREKIGHNLFSRNGVAVYSALYRAGMVLRERVRVIGIGEHVVQARHAWSGADETVPADTVVVALGRESDRSLMPALRGVGIEVLEAGDAVLPRTVGAAILDGFSVGRAV